MNYRHAFHAGNFADLVKHAALIAVLSRLTAAPEPLLVVDTHGGAGLYDLEGPEAVRSREAEAGAARLMSGELPPVMQALRRAVRARNPSGVLKQYPGSPALTLDLLRPQDRLVACELRDDDYVRLGAVLGKAGGRAQALQTDGFSKLVELAKSERRARLFALIDPPFERADDYLRLAQTLDATLQAKPGACLLAWLPLKDLETIDGFVRRLEAFSMPLIAEMRLRPLTDPMRMNGCALAAINAPDGAEADIEAACAWVAETLGDPGGRAKLWRP